MIRIILIASIALLLAGCGDGSSEPELSKDIKYTISEDAHTRGIKRGKKGDRPRFSKKGDRPRFSTKLNRRRGRNWGRTTSVSRAGVSGRAT
jgi:hypothetical protein